MQDQGDASIKPLNRMEAESLPAATHRLMAHAGLPLAPGGWVVRIDGGLKDVAILSTSAIELASKGLSPCWADVYLIEWRQRLTDLELRRQQYQDISARFALQMIEQDHLDGIDAIQRQEVAAGWFELPSRLSGEDVAGQSAWATATDETKRIYATAIKDPQYDAVMQKLEVAMHQRAWLASAASISTYWKAHSEQAPTFEAKHFVHAPDPVLFPGPLKPSKPVDINEISFDKPVFNFVYSLAKTAYAPEVVSFQTSFASQVKLTAGSAEVAAAQLRSKSLLHDYQVKDVNFRRSRAELGWRTNDLRRHALAHADGPANCVPRLEALRNRFCPELAELLAKALVAVDGFSRQWGAPAVMPVLPEQWDDSAGSYLDHLLLWFDELERLLSRFALKEESAVVTVSVRSSVTPAEWQKAKEAAKAGPFSLQFHFPESHFGTLQYVRLRGISGFVVGVDDVKSGVWRGEARLPKVGNIIAQSGPIDRDQGVHAVTLGRLQTRNVPRPADVVGTTHLRNLSPISGSVSGDWQLVIDGKSSQSTPIAEVDDIVLDLYVAGIRGERVS